MKVFALVAASLTVGNNASQEDRTLTKVIKVLQDMLAKSKKEGDDEREIYAKFKCFCDQNEQEKTDSVAELTQTISLLSSKIEELQGAIGALNADIAQLTKDIDANEKAQGDATGIRTRENEFYVKEKADMEQAIGQMNQAIDTLSEIGADQTLSAAEGRDTGDSSQFMSGFKGKFLQASNSKVRQALEAVSGFLTPAQSKSVQSFLQSGAPFTGTYSSQSGQIIGILKSMRDTFKENLENAIQTEKQQLEAYDNLMATLTGAHTEMSGSRTKKQDEVGAKEEDLASKKTQLSEAKSQKENDEEYLAKLLDMCDVKVKQYNERKMMRANENAAVAEAIAILNSDEAFEAFGKTDATKTGATGATRFIQLGSRHVRVHAQGSGLPQRVKDVLVQSKSPRVARIAGLIQASNVFDTVLTEIDKMLGVIVKEGKADKENLDWCNSERTENDEQLSNRNNEIDALNGDIDELDTTINDPTTGLKFQIKSTETGLAENVDAQKKQTEERRDANMAYQQDVKNLVAAQSILKKAVKVLNKYYDKLAKRIAEKEGAELLQEDPDAPESWDTFKGQSSKGGDAVQMLQFILDESVKEEEQAHTDEEAAQGIYDDSMTDLKQKESADEKSLAELQTTLAKKEEELVMKHKELKATTKEKEAIETYLLKIKPGCDFITKNFDDREKNRLTETTALNKAKGLIKDTPVYKNFKAEEKIEGFGNCDTPCKANENDVKCKACLAKTSIPGYCAGHEGTEGC